MGWFERDAVTGQWSVGRKKKHCPQISQIRADFKTAELVVIDRGEVPRFRLSVPCDSSVLNFLGHVKAPRLWRAARQKRFSARSNRSEVQVRGIWFARGAR